VFFRIVRNLPGVARLKILARDTAALGIDCATKGARALVD
jgi:hypothetical protein